MRVLLVEDDQLNRRVVRDMLAIVSVDMDEAADAETGLRMIDDGDYDIVLMDLRMPGMDGLTAIRHVRCRFDAKQGVPIIVITADSGESMHERCISSGANCVLNKPVAMNALFNALGATLASSDQLLA